MKKGVDEVRAKRHTIGKVERKAKEVRGCTKWREREERKEGKRKTRRMKKKEWKAKRKPKEEKRQLRLEDLEVVQG